MQPYGGVVKARAALSPYEVMMVGPRGPLLCPTLPRAVLVLSLGLVQVHLAAGSAMSSVVMALPNVNE